MARLQQLLGILGIALIAGCATAPTPAVQYAYANRPLAESGAMKWSDYYTGLYSAILQSNQSGKSQLMARASSMIDTAKAYERGELSADQFESKRRQMQTAQVADDQAAQDRARLALIAASKNLADSTARGAESAYQIVQPVSAAAPRPAVTPYVATAYFTGKQQQVQTVTYQYGWSCEYSYGGQFFWRTFVGNCPSSVKVQ